MSKNFFPQRPEASPTIYAYELPNDSSRKGQLKIGDTNRTAQERIKEQIGAARSAFNIVLEESAMRKDGSSFRDYEIHKYLRNKGFKNTDGEWFTCSVKDVQAAIIAIKKGQLNEENRTLDFKMRPEQEQAVNKVIQYFDSYKKENPNSVPHFLWNAKMRFGKTFASYQLAKKQGWKKVLVLTFKPAVQSAWKEDLLSHVDFEGWQFISKGGLTYEESDKNRPFVCFGSFQDYLGKNTSTGGIKTRNEWVHATNWDCVIFDEYHYGAWNDNAKGLFNELYEDGKDEDLKYVDKIEKFDEEIIPISTDSFLYLSGTPFKALSSGEFIEEEIFNWTYSDEQKAKEEWKQENNPYATLPRMVMLTYQMPDSIREIALGGEYNEFDLNVFFGAKGEKENAKFTLENEVQKWLDLIRGGFRETTLDSLKQGAKKTAYAILSRQAIKCINAYILVSTNSCSLSCNEKFNATKTKCILS